MDKISIDLSKDGNEHDNLVMEYIYAGSCFEDDNDDLTNYHESFELENCDFPDSIEDEKT